MRSDAESHTKAVAFQRLQTLRNGSFQGVLTIDHCELSLDTSKSTRLQQWVTCRNWITFPIIKHSEGVIELGRWVISEDQLTEHFSSCSMYHQALEEVCYWIIIRLHSTCPMHYQVSSFDFIVISLQSHCEHRNLICCSIPSMRFAQCEHPRSSIFSSNIIPPDIVQAHVKEQSPPSNRTVGHPIVASGSG